MRNNYQLEILLAENSPDLRMLIKYWLEHAGYRVVEAADGDEAVKKALQKSPDFILTELSLPYVDGLAATRLIRQQPHLRCVPVVAISDYYTPALYSEALQAGCTELVTKPFTVDDLEKALQKSRLQSQTPRATQCELVRLNGL